MQTDLLGKSLALTAALCWAVAVIFFKRAGKTMPPLILNLYKTVVGVVLLLPLLFLLRIPLAPAGLPLRAWLAVIASGVLGIALADTLFFHCLNLVGAGLAAIAECLYTPFVMLLSWLVLAESLHFRAVLGAVLVIAGILLATFSKKEGAVPPRRLVLGMAAGAGGMLAMAVSIVLMKPVFRQASFFWVTEVRMLAALVAMLPLFLHPRLRPSLSLLSERENWRFAFPGAILGNVLSMTAWVAAFSLTDLTSASILNQTNTIFIVLLATLWLKEPFTRRRLLATILAVAGSLLVLLS